MEKEKVLSEWEKGASRNNGSDALLMESSISSMSTIGNNVLT